MTVAQIVIVFDQTVEQLFADRAANLRKLQGFDLRQFAINRALINCDVGRFFTIDVKKVDDEKHGVLIKQGAYVDHAIRVFGRVFAGFMCMRRDKAELIGGFLDYPYYRAWFLDPDLSLRVWQAGGKVETCNDAQVLLLPEPEGDIVASGNREKYYNRDGEAFRKRWGRDFSHEA